jgi:hypothetical protein
MRQRVEDFTDRLFTAAFADLTEEETIYFQCLMERFVEVISPPAVNAPL